MYKTLIGVIGNTKLPDRNFFTILEPRNQEIGQFHFVREPRAMDFEVPKLRKGRSGSSKLRT